MRQRVLEEGKKVLKAVPRLAAEHPVLLLDPGSLTVSPRQAASISGTIRHGTPIGFDRLRGIPEPGMPTPDPASSFAWSRSNLMVSASSSPQGV